MPATIHPFFARRVATPTPTPVAEPIVEPVATPTPIAEPVAEPVRLVVQDLYGNFHHDFTEAKYEAFTHKGIQLKRLVGKGVWRRNEPWKKTVRWDAVDEDERETYEERAAREEYEWYVHAVYLCDVDRIPDELE
jgi:hypothetical protein